MEEGAGMAGLRRGVSVQNFNSFCCIAKALAMLHREHIKREA